MELLRIATSGPIRARPEDVENAADRDESPLLLFAVVG